MKKSLLMKTMLLLFALVVGSTCAWAVDAVLPSTQALTTSFAYVGSDTHIQIKTSAANTYTEPLRFYANNTVTIKADDGYVITSVTYEASSTGNYVTYAQEATVTPNVTPTVSGKNVTWALNNVAEFTFKPATQTRANSITISYTTESSSSTCATPTFSPAAGFYTSAQNVTISSTTDGATIYYTTNGDAPTTSSNVYSGAINVSTSTTIKAMAVKDNYDNSSVASATYTISAHAGTEADPYSVADARNAIDANTGVTGVYVKGIVCEGGSSLASGAMNYWISDDGTETNKLEIYKGKGLNAASFSSVNDVKVGDIVVVTGNLTKYNSTYEFAQNSVLVSLDRPVIPIITANNVTIESDATSGEIAYSISNPTGATLTVATTADWISNITVTAEKVTFTATANTGAQRTATITLSYTGAADKAVTVTQKKCTYATLPFAFDGGKSDVANTLGLTHSGLGSDYNSSPKLKFDNTGDNLILKINEVPGSLSFDIKGYSFSDGTFTVQTSADGENYTDLKAYTALDVTQTETFALASNVRYIKWVYTEKESGNVGLGNISLVANAAEVTVSAAGLATFASDSKLDFTNVENLEAYIAKEVSGAIKLEKVNKVPAGTGVLLRAKNDATDFNVPVTNADADNVTGNLFVRGAGAAVESGTGPYNYVLGKHNGVVGFYKAGGMTVATDKAYIQTTLAAARIDIDFSDDDVTGIGAALNDKGEMINDSYFDLQGRKVAQPQKGLYIVNGKKVVIK